MRSKLTVTNRDIYASAKMFIDQHGDDALMEAMRNMAKFENAGDLEGRECWNQIAYAIEWMQMPQNLTGEKCH